MTFPTFEAWRSAVRHSYVDHVIKKAASPDEISRYMDELDKAFGLTEEKFAAFKSASIEYALNAETAKQEMRDLLIEIRKERHAVVYDSTAKDRADAIHDRAGSIEYKARRKLERASQETGIDRVEVKAPWWRRWR